MKKLLTALILGLFVLTLSACDLLNSPGIQNILSDLTISGVEDIEVAVGAEVDLLEGVTVLGDDEGNYLDDLTLDSTCTITDGILDTSTAGTCTVTYEVVVGDITTFQTITVTITADAITDNDPVITGAGDVLVEEGMTFDPLDSVVAADVEDGDLTSSITYTVTGPNGETTFDDSVDGIWTFVYSVTDADDNTVTVSRAVTIGELLWVSYGYDMALNGDAYTFTYSGVTAQFWNMNAQYPLAEALDASISAVEFTFTGELGQDYIFKAEGPGNAYSSEVSVTATGEEEVVSVPLDTLTAEEITGLEKLVLFATTVDGAGSVTVHSVQFVMAEPAWVAYGWTMTQSGSDYVFEFSGTDANQFWNNNAQFAIDPALDANATSVDVTLTAPEQDFMLKIEITGGANLEVPFTGTGAEQVVSIPLDGFTAEQIPQLSLVVLFATTVDGTGTVTVHGVDVVVPEPTAWNAYGWTMSQSGDDFVFEFSGTDANQFWNNNAQYTIDPALDANATSVDVTLTAPVQDFMLKIEITGGANLEVPFTGTGAEQVVSIPLDGFTAEQIPQLSLIVLFATTVDGTGTITVHSVDVVVAEPTDWVAYGWTMSQSGDDYVFEFSGTDANQFWNNNAQFAIAPALEANATSVEVTLTAPVQDFMLKIEITGGAFLEVPFTGTGAEQVVSLPLDGFTAEQIPQLTLIVLFATTVDGTGTVTVHSVDVVAPEPTTWNAYGWTMSQSGDDFVFEFSGTDANQFWNNNAQYTIDPPINANATSVDVTLTAPVQDFMLKIEITGGAFLEVPFTGTGAEQVVSIPLDGFTAEQIPQLNLVVLFATTVDGTGTVTVHSVDVIMPAWIAYGWTMTQSGDDYVFDFSGTDANQFWNNNAQYPLMPAIDATATSVDVTLTAPVQDFMLKIEITGGAFLEVPFTGTGAEQVVSIPLDGFTAEQIPQLTLIVLFATTVDGTGTVTVHSVDVVLPS
ncbi:DUF5011 domain-containing protein [Candidatus Xianfuyuplasma coldseepsis]|uniref:DUF5011 domain-containing protein n=1 Tax=Candidatus Xianfuyuplasma coldseepsis TaxID=2782163 RepID=A0A7L7KNV0_9MOLU|nr:DUF5011 domain-containing protein [Xianfuyuplasma coldseepsis]QMS84441.1 DUF5011 domain-containing protein [Xianfuyuplasma coldseepsis]